jgi:hypothetical protein
MKQSKRMYAVIALLVTTLISAVHSSVVQARDNPRTTRALALACGKELKNQCSGVPVKANNMLECLQKSEKTLSA